MASYTEIITSIEAEFASTDWTDKEIPTYPADYNGNRKLPEFITLSVLVGDSERHYGGTKGEVGGLLYIEVYTASGRGQRRPFEIADMLDTLLENKILTDGVETFTSTVGTPAKDTANESLSRTEYTLPFKTFGS